MQPKADRVPIDYVSILNSRASDEELWNSLDDDTRQSYLAHLNSCQVALSDESAGSLGANTPMDLSQFVAASALSKRDEAPWISALKEYQQEEIAKNSSLDAWLQSKK